MCCWGSTFARVRKICHHTALDTRDQILFPLHLFTSTSISWPSRPPYCALPLPRLPSPPLPPRPLLRRCYHSYPRYHRVHRYSRVLHLAYHRWSLNFLHSPLPPVSRCTGRGDASGFKSGFFASPGVAPRHGLHGSQRRRRRTFTRRSASPTPASPVPRSPSPLAALLLPPAAAAAAAPAGALASASLAAPPSSPPITASPARSPGTPLSSPLHPRSSSSSRSRCSPTRS